MPLNASLFVTPIIRTPCRYRAMRITVKLFFAILIIGVVGCGSESAPKVPEGTAIQDYLDANPDYIEEAGAPESEEEEMNAAGAGE